MLPDLLSISSDFVFVPDLQHLQFFWFLVRHVKVLKDALIGTGYDARLIDRQFRRATAKICNDLLRRQTRDTTDRVPFVVQYFPGAETLRHVLRSLQHIIDDDEHFTKIFSTPTLFTFKQPSKLKKTIVHSKPPSLQDNVDHNTIQPCHGNLCKTCQIFDMDTTVTHFGIQRRVTEQRLIAKLGINEDGLNRDH
eukprot:g26611.t1